MSASVAEPRWIIQTWSRSSTETPIDEPSTQWFGSGFGQYGIDFEVRRLHGVLALAGQLARDEKAGGREDSQQEKCPAMSQQEACLARPKGRAQR